MKKKYTYFSALVVLSLYAVPFFVFAETDGTFRTFVLGTVKPIVNYFLVILYSLSVLIFLWGLAKFILNADSDSGREKGKKFITWGLLALFILGAFNGIIFILSRTFFNVEVGDPTRYLPEDSSDFD